MGKGADFLLLERAGLPDDQRWLTEKYPRETWQGHANLDRGDRALGID